ncbi:MAG TPA: outer membrane protein transport protein [Candidatus Acidoferrum sp.]|nr:outer membrane protein transport protein [Candidatus Acidoferrum sp.]
MKRPRLAGALALVCLLGGLAHPASLFALGIRLPDQDAFATARGNAFAATANDPSAIYYNPAGITQLEGANFSLGMYGITFASRYTSAAGSSINSQQEWGALPQTFSTLSFTNYHLALGLGVYSPYGLSFEWPNKAPWAPAGQEGEINYIRANPVLAWQPCDTLSIAAGVMLDYSQSEFKTPAFSLHGRDTDVGFNAAILWHPLPQHSFGLTYRSATDMNYNGHVSFLGLPLPSQPAKLNFHLPQTVTGGYSYRPTTNWNLEVDADWTDWTSLRNAPIQTGPVPIPALGFNWKPSTIYEFGATRYLGAGWRASAGYMFSENSVPNSFFNPLVPDSDRHLFSVGVGKTYKHLSWDAAYQLGIGPSRSVAGDINPKDNGSYEFLSNALSFNIGWHF